MTSKKAFKAPALMETMGSIMRAAWEHPKVTGAAVVAAAVSILAMTGGEDEPEAASVAELQSGLTAPVTDSAPQYYLDGKPVPGLNEPFFPNYTDKSSEERAVAIGCRGVIEKTIVEGDTVSEFTGLIDTEKIGLDLLQPVSVAARVGIIAAMNDLEDPGSIQIGRTLAIPAQCAAMSVRSANGS